MNIADIAEMSGMADLVDRMDWRAIEGQLGQDGCALLPGLLDDDRIAELASFADAGRAIGTTSLEAEGLGRGDRFPLPADLPDFVAELGNHLYRRLVPVANAWNAVLDVARVFPAMGDERMTREGGAAGRRARASLTRLRVDDYAMLHQHGESAHAFPLQLVALLSEPGVDFTGGEFVLTEQRPRMQSRPMVLPLRRGDMAVFAVARRPHKGSAGHYRVNLKHAVSRVRGGERIGFELLFDDAASK